MTSKEAVNWIINLSADIGKSQHSDLWHYEQALSEIKDMLEADLEIIYCKDCDQYNPEAQFCDLVQFNFLPKGHCSWGRRKENRCRNVTWTK